MTMWKQLIIVAFLWAVLATSANAQLTMILKQIPDHTPPEDSLFITGSFNEWNPKDVNYVFTKDSSSQQHVFTFPILPATFSYKITRGNWKTVEGSKVGQSIVDREFVPNKEQDTIYLKILSWEDMVDSLPNRGELNFRVTRLPGDTPPGASIFLVGNFNDWHPGDPNYKLTRQEDGFYQVKLKVRSDTILYKFTRGNWETAEGGSSGRAIHNRQLIYHEHANEKHIDCRVETWEDLSGTPFNTYTILLLLAAFQGILLIVAINTIQDNNKAANRILSLLILLTSIALIGRVSTYDREIFQWQPKLLLLPDLVYFLVAPLFLFYIQKLLLLPSRNAKQQWLHFIPAGIQFCAYIPLIFMDSDTFVNRVVDLSLRPYFALAGGIALLYNAFYWWKSYRLVHAYETSNNANYSFEENLKYLNTIILLIAICLAVWLVTYGIGIAGITLGQQLDWITDKSTDAVWILFALLIFCLGYFAMKQPEIFKVPEETIEEQPDLPTAIPVLAKTAADVEEFAALKKQLEEVMVKHQPFLNPKLSLAELAQMVNTNVHTLSKAINEGFDKNFYDFVNSYRIEAFIQRVPKKAYRNHTFLAVAFSVGFNSKTAFNRSFKKLTGQTPRQYFRAQKEA